MLLLRGSLPGVQQPIGGTAHLVQPLLGVSYPQAQKDLKMISLLYC